MTSMWLGGALIGLGRSLALDLPLSEGALAMEKVRSLRGSVGEWEIMVGESMAGDAIAKELQGAACQAGSL